MADDAKQDCPPAEDCPSCPPPGAPAWMATFSDLITLLMTFFVLLYATSKQDSAKFESMAGSIRNAFGGNSKNIGDVVQLGKSPDDAPTFIEAQEPVAPFPIDFQTTEGMLDKYEINRASDEDLSEMKKTIKEYELNDNVNVYQVAEGVRIDFKDKVFFEKNSIKIENIAVDVLEKLIKLMRENDWTLYIQGHAESDEYFPAIEGSTAYELSSQRALAVTKYLIKNGIRPEKISTMFYGDSKKDKVESNRKVEFYLRKVDASTGGKKVNPHFI